MEKQVGDLHRFLAGRTPRKRGVQRQPEATGGLGGHRPLRRKPGPRSNSEEFRELALRYTTPTSARLVDFLGRASFRPGKGARKSSFEITGRGFIDANDSVRIRVESETNRPFKYFFRAVLDGSPATGEVDFSQVKDGGPWYASRVLIKIPEKSTKAHWSTTTSSTPVTPTGSVEPKRPFDVREYGQAAAEISQAAENLETAIQSLEKLVASPAWESRQTQVNDLVAQVEAGMDRATWRLFLGGLILIVVFLGGGLIVLLIYRRQANSGTKQVGADS